MAKVMSTGETYPQLPPTDRELALRAQIKTGWSTYHKSSAQFQRHCLSHQEMKVIHEVVEKAQAMEHMEEIRIGLLMLKHQQMTDNCRGDGVSTCRICNRDFTSQRSSKPEPIQYCQDCQMVICSRCKNVCKMMNGQDRILCTVCHEKRELWKKSGAWLDHSVPTVSIPQKDLEEIQQQQVKTTKYTIGRKRESTLLMNPYHCIEESDDEDTLDTSAASKSRLQFNRSPDPSPTLRHKGSPIPEITTPRAKQLGTTAFNAGAKSSSDSEDQRSLPVTTYKTRSFSRKAGLSRKGAIAGAERGRLQKSRERAHSRSNSPGSHSRSTSPSSNAEMGVADRETGGALPSIKVSSIPSRPPPTLFSHANRNSTPESEDDSPKKLVIRQMHVVSSTDSESIQVATREPLSISKDDLADRSFTARTPKTQPFKPKSEGSEEIKSFIDEFKKVKSPPNKPPPVNESSKPAEDEFKKVKIGTIPRKSLPTEEQAAKIEDEFKKAKSNTPPSKPPPVVESSKKAEDEFKKTKSSTIGRSTKTPEREMKTRTLPRESGSKVSGGSADVGGEFKKVGPKTSPQRAGGAAAKSTYQVTKSSPKRMAAGVGTGDVETKTEKTRGEAASEEIFKKVSLPRGEQKPVIPTRRKVLPDLPSSGPSPPFPPTDSPPSHPPPSILPPRETPPLSTSASPSHGRRLRPLPPSGPVPPLPEKPAASSAVSSASNLGSNLPMLVDAGKQSSITSVGSSVPSEYTAAAFDVDSGMASPSSLGSTDSVDTSKQSFSFDRKQQDKETSSETATDSVSSRGFDRPTSLSRRNASRVSHAKRPPPRPNLDGEEDKQAQDQGEAAGPMVVRPRARSRVIRKRPQAMSGGAGDLQQPDNSQTLEEESDLGAAQRQRRSRTRATALTSADKARARGASTKSEGGEQTASNWNADGENQ